MGLYIHINVMIGLIKPEEFEDGFNWKMIIHIYIYIIAWKREGQAQMVVMYGGYNT